MNDYTPQPLPGTQQEKFLKSVQKPFPEPIKEQPKTPWLRTILFIILTIGLAAALGWLVVVAHTTQNSCDAQVENATNISLSQGYLTGVYDTSQLVLNEGILPVFMEDGSLQYLNLTKLQEEK